MFSDPQQNKKDEFSDSGIGMSGVYKITDPSGIIYTTDFKNAVDSKKNNQTALQAYLDIQKNNVLSEIAKQKSITFDKVYGDLTNVSNVQGSMIVLDQRTNQLDNIQKQVSSKQEQDIHNVKDDKQLAKRKVEMNEWSVENKKETLFIYSIFFMLLTISVFLSALVSIGTISSYLCTSLVALFVIIFIIIVLYRARLTTNYRNKRYWHKRSFDEGIGKFRIPNLSLCPKSE